MWSLLVKRAAATKAAVFGELAAMFGAVVPVFLVLGGGFVARRVGWLDGGAQRPLMQLTINVFFPGLIFKSMMGNRCLNDLEVVGMAAGMGFVMVLVSMGLALGVGRLMGLKHGDGLRTFCLAGGVQNYGYFAIPLVMALDLGDDALGVLFTHNVGVELAIWSVGVAVLAGNFSSLKRVLRNGPVIAVVVSLVLVWSGLERWVPEVLLSAFGMVGGCAVPVGVFLVGMALAELWGKERLSWRILLGGVVVRNVLIPMLYLGILWMVSFPSVLVGVLVVQAAMPGAIFPVVIAKYYGGRPQVAAQVALSTTVCSVISMPLVIGLGRLWYF